MIRDRLVSGLLEHVQASYFAQGGQTGTYGLMVLAVDFYETASGAARVRLVARDLAEPGPPKNFFSNRLTDLVRAETGEVFADGNAYVADLIARHGGRQPPVWPAVYVRVSEGLPDFARDPARAPRKRTRYAVGWAFLVPEAFEAALDIAMTPRQEREIGPDGEMITRSTGVRTRGRPPRLDFSVGDLLATSLDAHPDLQIQVVTARPADPEARDPGAVRVLVRGEKAGDLAGVHDLTQGELETVLRTGMASFPKGRRAADRVGSEDYGRPERQAAEGAAEDEPDPESPGLISPAGLDLDALLALGDHAIAAGRAALDAVSLGPDSKDVLVTRSQAEAIGLGALVLRARALAAGSPQTYGDRYRKACRAVGYDQLPDNLRRRAMVYPIMSGDDRLEQLMPPDTGMRFRLGAVAERVRQMIGSDGRLDWLPFGRKWGPEA